MNRLQAQLKSAQGFCVFVLVSACETVPAPVSETPATTADEPCEIHLGMVQCDDPEFRASVGATFVSKKFGTAYTLEAIQRSVDVEQSMRTSGKPNYTDVVLDDIFGKARVGQPSPLRGDLFGVTSQNPAGSPQKRTTRQESANPNAIFDVIGAIAGAAVVYNGGVPVAGPLAGTGSSPGYQGIAPGTVDSPYVGTAAGGGGSPCWPREVKVEPGRSIPYPLCDN